MKETASNKRDKMMIEVASMYYLQQMSQQEIATALKTSRSNISRLLRLSIEEGIVEFKIKGMNHTYYPNVREKLIKTYNLTEVIIVKTGSDIEETKKNIAEGGANYFLSILKDSYRVGISWGSTLQEFTSALTKKSPLVTSDVYQLAGGYSSKATSGDSFDVAKTLAEGLHGECYVIRAPFLVENEVLKALMMQEGDMKEHFEQLSSLDIVLTGIGHVEAPQSPLYKAGCLSYEDCSYICSQGAVADICGRQITEFGDVCETDISRRVIGISLEQIKNTKMTIALAGGIDKKKSILAALHGNYINTLVTDEITALSLIS